MTFVATIAVIALLAVSIGFAYTAYSQNGGNNTEVSYITIIQTQTDAQTTTADYTFADNEKIIFSTYSLYDGSEKVYYKIDDSHEVGAYTCADLGNVTFNAKYTGKVQADAPDLINVDVNSSSGFDGKEQWVYLLTDSTYQKIFAYCNDGSTWTDGPDAFAIRGTDGVYTGVDVHLMYGYPTVLATTEIDGMRFLTSVEEPVELSDAKITFKATDVESEEQLTTAGKIITYKVSAAGEESKTVKVMAGYAKLLTADPFGTPAEKEFRGWATTEGQTEAINPYQTINANITYYIVYVDPQP